MINKHHSHTVSKRQRTLGLSGILAVTVFLITLCFVMGFTFPQSSISVLTTTPSPKYTTTPLPTSTISHTATPQPSNSVNNLPAEKDWWDKAGVISQFFSGVVIAVVGLLITYTIQRTQIKVSQETSSAQIKSAEIQSSEDRRLQQGQLTAQLVEYLTSDSAQVREIAIVALHESVPEKIYDSVVEILARSDKSETVREKAIQQLGFSQNNEVVKTLDEIAKDPNRSNIERDLASKSASRVVFSSNLPPETFVLTSTSQNGISSEIPEFQSGLFTHYLLEGLGGKADIDANDTISASELSDYVSEQVMAYSRQNQKSQQMPNSIITLPGKMPIVGKKAPYSSIIGLIIGVNHSLNPDIPPLQYAKMDARRIYQFFTEKNKDTSSLILLTDDNATIYEILSTLNSVVKKSTQDSLFLFYYSGMGLYQSDQYSLMASDGSVPFTYIKEIINQTSSISKVIFLDASYSGVSINNASGAK